MRPHHILRPISTPRMLKKTLLKLLGGLGFFCGSNEMKGEIMRKEGKKEVNVGREQMEMDTYML